MTHEQYLENREHFLEKHLISHHGWSPETAEIVIQVLSEENAATEFSDAHRYEHTNNSPTVAHRHTD